MFKNNYFSQNTMFNGKFSRYKFNLFYTDTPCHFLDNEKLVLKDLDKKIKPR